MRFCRAINSKYQLKCRYRFIAFQDISLKIKSKHSKTLNQDTSTSLHSKE